MIFMWFAIKSTTGNKLLPPECRANVGKCLLYIWGCTENATMRIRIIQFYAQTEMKPWLLMRELPLLVCAMRIFCYSIRTHCWKLNVLFHLDFNLNKCKLSTSKPAPLIQLQRHTFLISVRDEKKFGAKRFIDNGKRNIQNAMRTSRVQMNSGKDEISWASKLACYTTLVSFSSFPLAFYRELKLICKQKTNCFVKFQIYRIQTSFHTNLNCISNWFWSRINKCHWIPINQMQDTANMVNSFEAIFLCLISIIISNK